LRNETWSSFHPISKEFDRDLFPDFHGTISIEERNTREVEERSALNHQESKVNPQKQSDVSRNPVFNTSENLKSQKGMWTNENPP